MVYPKTHPTEFMKIKGVQLAGLVTTLEHAGERKGPLVFVLG